jgi:hypothetical protein
MDRTTPKGNMVKAMCGQKSGPKTFSRTACANTLSHVVQANVGDVNSTSSAPGTQGSGFMWIFE